MTIVLHIGVSKTGSSAIQYGLAKHQKELAARGVHYALEDATEVVEQRLISSGNGAILTRLLNSRRGAGEDLASFDFDAAFVSPQHRISLISSEGLSGAEPDLIQRFRDEVIGAREVRILALVRDLYGHAASSWMQRIKRHGFTGRFEAFCAKAYGAKPCAALRRYAEAFGPERMTVLHYDSLQESAFHALVRALGVSPEGMEPPPRINRSLSTNEIEVLLACNQAHRDMAHLSARISDHLIYKHPDRSSDPVASPRAARILEEMFAGEVDWVNRTFFEGRPVMAVGGPGQAPEVDATPTLEIWTDAIEAVGRRLASVEAENRRLKGELATVPDLVAQRDRLAEQVARLKAQSWLEKLKLDVVRGARGRPPAAGLMD